MKIWMVMAVPASWFLALAVETAAGQSANAHRAGERIVLPRAQEISMARSAAPA